MTDITPGTHLVVGEPFTGKIPAGTPFIEVLVTGDVVARLIGWQHDVAPKLPGTSIRHRLTVEAPVPTPDKFQPGTVAWMRLVLDADDNWIGPDGGGWFGNDEPEDASIVRGWINAGTARLTHVPTPPAMTREQAEQIVADAPADVRAAVEVLRGGGEA